MKRLILKFLKYFVIIFFLTTNGQEKFSNPIIKGGYPDPSICKVGDTFYIVNSSFEYFPGLPIHKSKDLINWELIGYGLHRKSQVDSTVNLIDVQSNGGIHAPTIRHKDGVYYIITTNVYYDEENKKTDMVNFIITAENPAGPWSDPTHIFGAPGNDPRMIARQNIKYMKQARTNPDGRFQISGLRSNDYFVIVDVPKAKTWDLANTKPTGLNVQEISLESAQEIKIDFDLYTGDLRLNHPNQKDRAHTLVRLQPVPEDGRKNHQVTCLSYRSETKITNIPSGNYKIKLSGKKDTYDIFIPEGREAEVDITLRKRKPLKNTK